METTEMTVHRKEFTTLLPVELTEEEFHEAAKEMADAHITMRQTKEKRKGSNTTYGARIDAAQTRADENAQLIEDGHRMQEVKCEQIFDYEEKSMTRVRLDVVEGQDGRIIEIREMTEDEMQMEFPEPGDDGNLEDQEPAEEPEEPEEAEEPEAVEV